MNFELITQILLWMVAGLMVLGAAAFLTYGWYRRYEGERQAQLKKQRYLNGLRTYR